MLLYSHCDDVMLWACGNNSEGGKGEDAFVQQECGDVLLPRDRGRVLSVHVTYRNVTATDYKLTAAQSDWLVSRPLLEECLGAFQELFRWRAEVQDTRHIPPAV